MTQDSEGRLGLLSRFYLCYQPIYRLGSRALLGVEALLRHADGIGPLELLDIVRRESLIPRWELAVLERAAGEVLADGARVETLFFNLTPEAYMSGEFRDGARLVLARLNVQPARLCVEVSEGAVYPEEAYRRQAAGWFELGCRIALDDFGRGESNVSLLVAARPDFAKI
ncbi:MAG: EAL domain-containing protein, partial [Moorellales bacterium]